MSEQLTVTKKRRPGIPHETLEWIAIQAGGTIEHFLKDKDTWVRLTLGEQSFEAINNTALLIVVLGAVKQ